MPAPTGPYSVGTLTFHRVDASRPETMTSDPSDRRELVVRIWYPAEQKVNMPSVPYLYDFDSVGQHLAGHAKMYYGIGDSALDVLRTLRTNTVDKPIVAKAGKRLVWDGEWR